MSPRHSRLFIAASATSLTLLAFFVAGPSSSPTALLLAAISLVTPIVMPLWLGVPAIAPAGIERRT
jgi:hypothetical protein